MNSKYKFNLSKIIYYSKPLIMFQNKKIMGNIPYKNYNVSILKLKSNEINIITNKKYNEDGILIIFFTSSIGKRYGSMSWIGIILYNSIIQLFNNKNINKNIWIIEPHLLQNDLGPKCADLRIFKLKNNIAIIGYSRVAPKSNINNIADYYVRASILNTKINNNLYIKSNNLYSFNEIDGGFFPSKIKNNYKKFTINNNRSIINNLEFYIKNNDKSGKITPHKSKDKLMPTIMKLNGIEVSFSKLDNNENPSTHISRKNVIPLQHKSCLENIGCFVDLTPPDSTNSLITIQNLETCEVYHTDTININNKFKSKKYRGSTPFIELNNNIWITLVHYRSKNNKYKYGLIYDYYITFYSSKKINIMENYMEIPDQCLYEIKLNDKQFFDNEFIYITGLIVDKEIKNKDFIELHLLISYGISDDKSGISLLKLKIPKI